MTASQARDHDDPTSSSSIRRVVHRPITWVVVLLVVYGSLALFNSTDGYLGTDTGAKVATLDQMVASGSFRPDVGYWAQEWDPDGEYHPLLDTRQNDRGEWINVTTLPMLLAAWPLYAVGGYRLALLLPMAGSIAAALACRDVARQLAGELAGIRTFWIVGLASPMLVYGLDLWEHSIGAALMLWATAVLLKGVGGDHRLRWPLLAGVALSAAATMRTEAFVVALVVVAVSCLALSRDHLGVAVRSGILSIVGFVGPWFGNRFLEQQLGGNDRGARVAGAAGRNLWDELADRGDEAAVTWFSVPGIGYPMSAAAGAAIVILLLAAVALHRRSERRAAVVAVVAAGVLYVLVLGVSGLAFVSGALVASPVAIGAFWLTRTDRPQLVVLASALSGTVGIWLFQYLGGAGPQWGGRYILVPTLLLTTLGVLQLGSVPAFIGRSTVVFAVAVSLFGVAWLSERSHGVDRLFDDLGSRPEEVVIATNGFLVREAGAAANDRRYLSLSRSGDLSGAVSIVDRSGLETFGVITGDARLSPSELGSRPTIEVGVDELEFLGGSLYYHRFVFNP